MPGHCAGRCIEDLDKCSDVRMRKNYVTKGIPKTSYRIHHLYVC